MTEGHQFSFPDDSRGELDRALDDLMSRARDVLGTQGRLRALLKANQAVIEHIDLPVVLRRIVESALELVGAQYGALGVIAPDGALEQFINVGMSPELVTQIGHLPEGHGLLGALIKDPHPIRIPRLSDDPRSVGFPAGHPPMASFLGVPIRVRDEVYGNLYLSNQSSGEFSEEDEQLVTALAATAGIAIENARLFAETRRRQSWAAASAEITAALMSNDDSDVLSILAARVLTLSDADVVWVLQPTNDPERMVVRTARGIDDARLQGEMLGTKNSLSASVVEGRQPRLIDNSSDFELTLSGGRAIGPVMAVPMVSSGKVTGVLLVGRLRGVPRFSRADLELAAGFAGQASVAMELTAARVDRQRVAMLEDRGRIARDLHDRVIQQLFATGLELQSIAGSASPDLAERIALSVNSMDASISQIRTVIFALSVPTTDPHDTVRHSIINLANELAPRLAHTPSVSFSGPVDLVITKDLAEDVIAVTREALVNVVKHASAEHTSIDLAVIDGEIRLEIVDDGHGAAGQSRRSGVSNLEQRALLRGGAFLFDSDESGTRLSWRVPLEQADSGAER
ncbi:GAF domain-containing protein [Salinibacterium sp.]|uniref:sensor histidine kinase n=1 Tax=Salinibacterium sp. TaxID=1915057 RepID=UPI00286C8D0D|nr:GAF domain-containing protein [Salinibacterium sp.]